jgi:hypothetical protein
MCRWEGKGRRWSVRPGGLDPAEDGPGEQGPGEIALDIGDRTCELGVMRCGVTASDAAHTWPCMGVDQM